MATYNHTCKVCGKGYNACDTCLNEKRYTPWRVVSCTQGHFQVYMVLWEYGCKTLEKADAREMLSKLDIDGWENYPEHNRVLIAEILKDEEKPLIEVVEPLAVEPPVVVDAEPLKAEEPVVVELPKQVVAVQPQGYKQPQKPYNNFQKHKK